MKAFWDALGATVLVFVLLYAVFPVVRVETTAPALAQATADEAARLTNGPAGRTEQRCIAGYVFVLGFTGTPAQLLDDQGHGVRCVQ